MELNPARFGLVLGDCEERSAEALATLGRMDRDVLEDESFVGNVEHEDPHDVSVAFSEVYIRSADHAVVIIGHRSREHSDALDIVSVRGVDEIRYSFRIIRVGGPKPIRAGVDRWKHATSGRRRDRDQRHRQR